MGFSGSRRPPDHWQEQLDSVIENNYTAQNGCHSSYDGIELESNARWL